VAAPYALPSVTTSIFVDSNRVDTYTPTGTLDKPFKTLSAALATVTKASQIVMAPGAYTEAIANYPLYPIVLYGNGSTLTLTVAATITLDYTAFDLNVVAPNGVTFAGVSASTKFLIRDRTCIGPITLSQGLLDVQSSTLAWNTTADVLTVSGGNLISIANINTLPLVQTGGTVNIENSIWNTARANTYLINSSVGQINIANSTIANTSATAGGGIYIHNAQTSAAPNAIANCVVGAVNAVNVASGVTLYSKVATTGTTVLTTAVGVPDVSGNILTNQSSASLGAETLSATWGLGTGWSGTFATGFTHTTGNTATLTEATTYTSGGLYTVAWTVTGRTAGSFTVAVGGISQGSITATGSIGPKFTATTAIVVTPTTDFDGTIVLSVKSIIAQPATSTWLDAAGGVSLEIRSTDASQQATAIGQAAGRNNTTGSTWTAIGYGAGRNNTTGSSWTAIGYCAGQNNTTGGSWTAIGRGAGQNNTAGIWWTAIGQAAGQNNTTGINWTAIGYGTGRNNTTGSSWTAIGYGTGRNNTTGSSWTAIGYSAGLYQLGSNWFAIDGYGDRVSAANELANTPIIGTLASTAAAQTLSLNAVTTVYSVNEQNTTLSTSQTLAANCTGNQVIGASSLSIALPTAPFAGEEITFLQHGYAFTLTAASAIIYYGSATAVASASIPAANAITRAIYDGSAWNVR